MGSEHAIKQYQNSLAALTVLGIELAMENPSHYENIHSQYHHQLPSEFAQLVQKLVSTKKVTFTTKVNKPTFATDSQTLSDFYPCPLTLRCFQQRIRVPNGYRFKNKSRIPIKSPKSPILILYHELMTILKRTTHC